MKNIILTGVTGGIGKTIAAKLLENEKVKIYGLARSTSKIIHRNYEHVICDFEDLKSVELRARHLKKDLPHLDGIIIAAGFGKFAGLEQFSLLDMQAIMNVNFLSQALLIKTFLPLLKDTENSKVIAIVSEASLQGAKKGTMYCASKFSMRGFLQSLRAECNRKKTAVTIVNPGLVKTKFFNELSFEPGDEEENYIKVEQIAKTVAFVLEMENNCVLEEIIIQPMKKVIKNRV